MTSFFNCRKQNASFQWWNFANQPTDSNTVWSEVTDKTLSFSQFLESCEPCKGPSIKQMKDFICSSFGNSFNKPVHSFHTCSCEGSQCTSVTQTEINHLQAASKKDRSQHIFIIDLTNFDAQKAGNRISQGLNFKIFWRSKPPERPSKGGLTPTYISLAAYFYIGRCLLQILLKALTKTSVNIFL